MRRNLQGYFKFKFRKHVGSSSLGGAAEVALATLLHNEYKSVHMSWGMKQCNGRRTYLEPDPRELKIKQNKTRLAYAEGCCRLEGLASGIQLRNKQLYRGHLVFCIQSFHIYSMQIYLLEA